MEEPISVVHSLAGAQFGGAESFYTRLTCALANNPQLQQYAFTRAIKDRVAQLQAAGIAVQTFRFGGRLDFIDHFLYRRALAKLAPQIVLSYMNRATILTPPGDYALVARLGHYYDLKYYRHCDYWIGNIRGICDHLVNGGMPANKVFHIPNFVEESDAGPLPRDSFDTPADQPLLLSAGRLHTNKAFDSLLHALRRIPNATLWLAGEGPERASLEALCEELGLSQRVRFLGWRNDIAALMKTADVFVCSSRHEGLGSIVLESWFNRCPIVSTRSQGPGELIEHGSNGLLTPIDDPEALASAVNELLNSPAQGLKLVNQAQQDYNRLYSKAVIAEQYTELFRRVAPN